MWTVVLGGFTMSRTWVQLWYNEFKEDQEDVNDVAHPKDINDENIEAVNKMFLINRRINFREAVDDIAISFGSCQARFTDILGMKCAAAKIVSKPLNFEKKQRHKDKA